MKVLLLIGVSCLLGQMVLSQNLRERIFATGEEIKSLQAIVNRYKKRNDQLLEQINQIKQAYMFDAKDYNLLYEKYVAERNRRRKAEVRERLLVKNSDLKQKYEDMVGELNNLKANNKVLSDEFAKVNANNEELQEQLKSEKELSKELIDSVYKLTELLKKTKEEVDKEVHKEETARGEADKIVLLPKTLPEHDEPPTASTMIFLEGGVLYKKACSSTGAISFVSSLDELKNLWLGLGICVDSYYPNGFTSVPIFASLKWSFSTNGFRLGDPGAIVLNTFFIVDGGASFIGEKYEIIDNYEKGGWYYNAGVQEIISFSKNVNLSIKASYKTQQARTLDQGLNKFISNSFSNANLNIGIIIAF